MKTIEPIQIWKDGQNKTASLLNARIINDDLSTTCTFYWQLFQQEPVNSGVPTGASYISLAEGKTIMAGEDYQNWDGSNDSAYQFVSSQINVVIATV